MQRVIDAVLAAGIPETDVAAGGFSIAPTVYADQQPARTDAAGPVIIAYEVSNQVTVRIDGIADSGNILNQVVAAGANRINGIRFDIAEPQPLRDEALGQAIAEARRQAELMADAAGVTLVRVLSVTSYANAQPMYDRAVAFAAAAPPCRSWAASSRSPPPRRSPSRSRPVSLRVQGCCPCGACCCAARPLY